MFLRVMSIGRELLPAQVHNAGSLGRQLSILLRGQVAGWPVLLWNIPQTILTRIGSLFLG